jgi:hypothetical protein
MTAAFTVLGGFALAAGLGDLTVPIERLPVGCGLTPSAVVREDGNRVRGGLWASLPIRTNPATSSEPPVVVEIRERVEGPTLTPDPPALSAREVARFRLKLAEGIEASYAAIYQPPDSSELVVLYGLQFADAAAAQQFWSHARAASNPRATGVVLGPIVAVATGPNGACLDAVRAHLQSLR